MDILKYFKEVKAQKQINRLAKKYKDKKIVIYGAGQYFQILYDNYDLSGLNIVGIADKKFDLEEDRDSLNPSKYTPLAPNELQEYDYDVIMVALYDDTSLCNYLEYELLIDTPNEGKEILSIIEPTFWYIIKILCKK